MAEFRKEIRDSVIVICGASSGFGRAAAVRLGGEGARVVLAARREHLLNEIEKEIRDAGGEATAVRCDVSRLEDVYQVARTALEQYGRIDVWINNVGIGALGYFWDIPVEDQARLIDINLKGLMYGAHVALRQFRDQGYGVLINTGSIDGEVPLAFHTTYGATKAAVMSMSRSLNEELRLSGQSESIRVAALIPWAVDTPWWLHAANYTGKQPRMAAMDDPGIVVDAIVRACTRPEKEMPVGPKARASSASHQVMPDLTEHLSSKVAKKEIEAASAAPPSSGSLFEPMQEGVGMHGGIRQRMQKEDHAPPH